MTERDYQTKAQAEIWQAWDSYPRVMFQLPTGGGKTVIITHLIKEILKQGKRVMFVAHRQELITQAWNTFYRNGITSGIIKAGVTPNYSLACQIGSVQTMIRRRLPKADFVFVDEAHHCLEDNSYGKIIAESFRHAKLLGVTATPYRLSGKGFIKQFDKLIESVDLTDLIDQGYLVPIRYYASSIPDLSKVKIVSGDYSDEMSAKVMELAPIVESYQEHCSGMSGLVFAVHVEHSKKIVRKYLEAGIPAEHVDATTELEVRKAIFQRLRDKKTLVVSNVGIATEGTDIPNIDFVQCARPTKAFNLFLQMIGRGLRADNDVIKYGESADHRKLLISCSAKPFCTVLDNAGLWKEHGLPDRKVDWQNHFRGYKKKKKSEEIIEIVEFVAEDEDGNVKRSKIPAEIAGMKLIEITKREREKIVNITSLREFDRLLALYSRLTQINKPGYKSYYDYKDYCRKNSILMTDEVWQYMELRLSTKEREQPLITGSERELKYVNERFHDDPYCAQLVDNLKSRLEKSLTEIRRFGVPSWVIRKERDQYNKDLDESGVRGSGIIKAEDRNPSYPNPDETEIEMQSGTMQT